jgi:hypothetical protein
MFVVWPSSVYEREHVTHGVLAGNTIVKMAGSGPGEGHPWSYLTGSLALTWASLLGAPMRTRGKRELLDTSVKIT